MKKPLDPKIVLAGSRLSKLLSCKHMLAFMKKEDSESKTTSSKGGVESHGELPPTYPLIKATPTVAGFWTSSVPPSLFLHRSVQWLATYCLTIVYWVCSEKTAISLVSQVQRLRATVLMEQYLGSSSKPRPT